MGRPFDSPGLLNLKARAAAVKVVRGGGSMTAAAAACGASYRTFVRWLDAGRKHPASSYAQFRAAILGAQAYLRSLAGGYAIDEVSMRDWKHLDETPRLAFAVVELDGMDMGDE